MKGYDCTKAKFLIDGFTHGFYIPFYGDNQFLKSGNLRSVSENVDVLSEYIGKERLADRIAGPFVAPPFQNVKCSPIFSVPKHTGDGFRTIHNLSYPEGFAVNDGIPEEYKYVQYQNIDNAVELTRKYKRGCFYSKCDIEHAYKIVPIHPSSQYLLGFSFNGFYYYDKTLPMGLSYSCNLFEQFSSALHWIAIHKLGIHDCVHILDDFLFVAPPLSKLCQTDLRKFLQLTKTLGIPIKQEKTVFPTTCITFLGLELDSILMEVRLPIEKLVKIRELLDYFICKRKATLKELQSLTGLLKFACSVVVPGRTFLRRLIDLTRGLKKPHHYAKLTREAKADLQVWKCFCDNFNGKSVILPSTWETSNSLRLFTDASDIGFGGYLGPKWFAQKWSGRWKGLHISVRELFPIIVALELWSQILHNKRIRFYSDNIAVVYVINKKTSKDKHIMSLLRRLVTQALKYNIVFEADHIPGSQNVIADKLSRFQLQDLKILAPQLEEKRTDVSHLMCEY